MASGPLPARVCDGLECLVDVKKLEACRRADVSLGLLQRRPPHTDLRLADGAREIRDRKFDLVRRGVFEEIGEQLRVTTVLDLGTMCDTCDFVFERMTGANQSVSPEDVAETLRGGLTALEGETDEVHRGRR